MWNIAINDESCSFDSGHRGNDLANMPNIEEVLIPVAQAASPVVAFFKDYARKGLTVYYDIRYLREQIEHIYHQHKTLKDYFASSSDGVIDESQAICSTASLYNMAIDKQIAVYLMKKIIDAIICEFECKFKCEQSGNNTLSKIPDVDIGKVLSEQKNSYIHIRNKIQYNKFKPLLETVNNLLNAYKHSIMTQERDFPLFQEEATFLVYHCRKGNFQNDSVRHVVAAFNDFLLFIFMGKEMPYTEEIIKGHLPVTNCAYTKTEGGELL